MENSNKSKETKNRSKKECKQRNLKGNYRHNQKRVPNPRSLRGRRNGSPELQCQMMAWLSLAAPACKVQM